MFDELLSVFCARWQRSYKRPYPVTPADRAQLGRFMQQNGNYIETFTETCDRYLSDRRDFTIARTNGHTLRWLVSNGLALYGGVPRETAEEFAARLRKEHEARKRAARKPPVKAVRELVLRLADGKAVK